MEKPAKTDLQSLNSKLKAINLGIEQNAEKMQDATVDDFMQLRRRNNELFIKQMATQDAINRLTKKGFCKLYPEPKYSVGIINRNRYAQ